jgi:TPR repeat protein
MRARSFSLWAAVALLLMVSEAWAQSSGAAPAQTKGIDPALLAKATAGDATSQTLVGGAYLTGDGVPEDYTQAALWWRKAAEQGDAVAEFMLGSLYREGQGVPLDYTQAALWIRKSAAQGNADAEDSLGRLYEKGQGVPQDDAQAIAWFRKAAEQGKDDAQVYVGVLYYSGTGLPQDYGQAAIWYTKAAEQGNAKAQVNLGYMYRNGQGLPQEYAQAAFWYRKAAEQGNSKGQYNLGLLYKQGKGVPQSYADAYFWLDLAVAQETGKEQEDDAQSRDEVAKRLAPEELIKVQERARVWFAAHQPETTTPDDTSNSIHKDTGNPTAAPPKEWAKAEVNQIRAIVEAIKQCPSKVTASAASTVSDGPPYNVTWDVSASQLIRAPYAGYIELTVPTVVHCSQQRRASSPQGCAIVERPQFPLVLRYEYDLSPDGLSLSKILVRGDNETQWSNRPNVSNFCWERAAQPTGAVK